MRDTSVCPACGAIWGRAQTCEDAFHLMLFWEWEHRMLDVHHLMVLCYYLQHPHLYSPEGLAEATRILAAFVEEGVSPDEMRQQLTDSERQHTLKGTRESHGSYRYPVRWTLTTAYVIAGEATEYITRVETWAKAVLAALRESGNLA